MKNRVKKLPIEEYTNKRIKEFMREDKQTGRVSEEKVRHFNCGECGGWWTIGDPRATKKEWHCPWCGLKQTFTLMPVSWLKKK